MICSCQNWGLQLGWNWLPKCHQSIQLHNLSHPYQSVFFMSRYLIFVVIYYFQGDKSSKKTISKNVNKPGTISVVKVIMGALVNTRSGLLL